MATKAKASDSPSRMPDFSMSELKRLYQQERCSSAAWSVKLSNKIWNALSDAEAKFVDPKRFQDEMHKRQMKRVRGR